MLHEKAGVSMCVYKDNDDDTDTRFMLCASMHISQFGVLDTSVTCR